MHPQDVIFNLKMFLRTPEGLAVSQSAFNQTISIVEAPTSLFDPQVYVHSSSLGSFRLLTRCL